MTENHKNSTTFTWPPAIKAYLVLVAIMVVLAGLQAVLPLEINQGQQMSWVMIVGAALLGLVGVALVAPKAGFPEMWGADLSPKQWLWLPFGVGAGLGVIMVLLDLISPLGTEIQTKFPDSLLVFSLAGLVEEIIVHLFLTTLLVWLISGLILRNRFQEQMFWLVAVGVGILYWLLQISAIRSYFPEKFSMVLAIQLLFVIGTTITLGAYFFRKSGFLAAVSLRYGFYLVWHIMWGGGIGLVRYFL
jgi:hypothetical protein